MIGANIKKLRLEHGMTQKNLADKLFVSAQAVSRWENNEVEPSLGTITEMAKIFGVPTDVILGVDSTASKSEPQVIVEKEYVYKEAPKQVLALCQQCNAPLYSSNDIVRVDFGAKVICKKCNEANQALEAKKKKEEKEKRIAAGERRRVNSFVWGGIAAGVWAFLGIVGGSLATFPTAIATIWISAMLFCYISCLILKNNFLGDMSLEIISWGFVKMPMVIFEFDLDGCLAAIGLKILLWVLEIGFAILAALFAFLLGMLLSVFVYPFAIVKNKRHPELS